MVIGNGSGQTGRFQATRGRGPGRTKPAWLPGGFFPAKSGPRFRHEGEVVAEPKPVPLRTLQFEYRFDRLLPEKLAQAYQVLRLVTSKCFLETDG